ncbi:MAG TPA: GTP-binding protein [Candidatus Methanomethylophilaceae archaeon]|nr:GTP-binding protein [Candidatus Methanomethylophilaceae archaeon]
MYVYILGGFLGSGKTSLMIDLTSMYIDRGKRVALIVNESGDIGVDGTTLKREGYDAIEMPQGCICCTLSSSLQTGVQNITRDIDPDILMIEPTGLALPNRVKEIVHDAMIGEEEIMIIGVADIQRFDDLIKRKEDFFKKQMAGSNFILVNKSDLSTKERMDEVLDWLRSKFSDREVIPISTNTGHNMDKLHEMMK